MSFRIETQDGVGAQCWRVGEIRQRFEITPKAHTKLLLPMIESLLAEAELNLTQLDALAFGCGPGSFTGLRIATGVVQQSAAQ